MNRQDQIALQRSFFHSALQRDGEKTSNQELDAWLTDLRARHNYDVATIPFDQCEQWQWSETTGYLQHRSERFFQIIGLDIEIHKSFPTTMRAEENHPSHAAPSTATSNIIVAHWQQPVLLQPEIGILGFITQVFDGIRYFLVQAKMEPGNPGLVQLSPTLQATESNMRQAHGGKKPRYQEYFLDHPNSRILLDRLQFEKSGRFLRKRNRNMIVEVQGKIPIEEHYCWLTLGQLKTALQRPDVVNMDARTVLSCISYEEFLQSPEYVEQDSKPAHAGIAPTTQEYLVSLRADKEAVHSDHAVLNWINGLKSRVLMRLRTMPVRDVQNWQWDKGEIRHRERDFFRIAMVRVHAPDREVAEWCQPLIVEDSPGLIGFLVKPIHGVLHFLVQAKVEPGSFDLVELAPTVSCANYQRRKDTVPFLNTFLTASTETMHTVRYDVEHSEEGGRFFQVHNRHLIVALPDQATPDLPDHYIWLTARQISRLMQHGYFNLEARSLMACSQGI